MVILVLNCGSSSIKYQVIDMEAASSKLLAKGIVERIGLPEGDLTHKPVGKEPFELHRPIPDHTTGIKLVLDALTDPAHGVIGSLDEVKAVGHRVAHGGEFFPESCIVTEEVKSKIRSLFEIAPLHNPANLEGVLSIEKVLPGVPQVTVFDTSFHQTIPAVNYMYALPHAYYDKYRVRKYGFHGTSHKYVAQTGARLAGLDFENSKIITCHIGNGASVTAVLNGKSHDTSMGFSPVDGLVMGTRCGNVIIDGPLSLDVALYKDVAEHKKVKGSSVAGDPDCLLFPNLESANVFFKSVTHLCGGELAAMVAGTKVPCVLTSRGDTSKTKLYSIALACLAVKQ